MILHGILLPRSAERYAAPAIKRCRRTVLRQSLTGDNELVTHKFVRLSTGRGTHDARSDVEQLTDEDLAVKAEQRRSLHAFSGAQAAHCKSVRSKDTPSDTG